MVVLASAAPSAVKYPARRPPSSVLRTTTAVVDPGVTTRTNVNVKNARVTGIDRRALTSSGYFLRTAAFDVASAW